MCRPIDRTLRSRPNIAISSATFSMARCPHHSQKNVNDFTGRRSSRWPASSSLSGNVFAADRLRRRSASTSRHHPSSSTSGQGARVGRLRIATSNARTVDCGKGPLRSRLRQRVGRGRTAGAGLCRARSHRLLPSFAMAILEAYRPRRVQPLPIVCRGPAWPHARLQQGGHGSSCGTSASRPSAIAPRQRSRMMTTVTSLSSPDTAHSRISLL